MLAGGWPSKERASFEEGGLDLAIVLGAVQQLGDRITLESEPGIGTTFCVSFPLPSADESG